MTRKTKDNVKLLAFLLLGIVGLWGAVDMVGDSADAYIQQHNEEGR